MIQNETKTRTIVSDIIVMAASALTAAGLATTTTVAAATATQTRLGFRNTDRRASNVFLNYYIG